ncbi:hypothetical protein SCHPADRAFT_573565 [Schizopora paradoxa]|uniref:DUF6533 domain-containing protein n=1 Tax=Schizopora paradoxa TaxID=27342 RepID=A0A0H2RBK2_9AGAM|nr:hypothetical protein SCHPADRAFT_573565 [Schizopora paradoxa]
MDSIVDYLHDQRRYTFIQTAALSWLAYDITLTFGDEVSFVWRRKWTVPKILYISARYFGLVILIAQVAVTTYTGPLPDNFCRRWLQFYSAGPIIIAFVVDALLVIRIYALYDRCRVMLSFLILLLIGQPVIVITTTIHALRTVQLYSKPSFLPFPGCLGSKPKEMNLTLIGWIFTLVSQAIFFVLTLYKYIRSIKDSSRHDGVRRSLFSIAKDSHDVSPLFSLFLRDGTANFFVIFASMMVNMIFTIRTQGPDQQFGIPWILATNAVMGSRLYLNLKGFIAGLAMPSLSAMERYVDLPSGATMTMISRDRLHLNWHNERTSFASRDSGIETISDSLSRRGQEEGNFTRILDCSRFDDVEKVVYHHSEKARIPSLVFEPLEFDGSVPEVIFPSDLESAPRGAGVDHGTQSPWNEPSSARSLTEPSTSESSIDSEHTRRPPFTFTSSDLVITGPPG